MKQIVLSAILLLGLLACGDVSASDIEQRLTILHTSEHHGAALPMDSGGQKVGGMAARAALVATVRRETERVLLVDSGDILIGTALSSAFRGEPDIKAMNLMGYQAMAAGNHEFDFGLDHFRRLNELAEFPILCSNIVS
jgi:5'-nucleotidase